MSEEKIENNIETKHYLQNFSFEKNSKKLQSFPQVHKAELNEDNEGGLDLSKFFAAVRRRVFVVAGVTITVATAAVLQALISKPTYESKFELLIKPVTVENKLSSSPLNQENEQVVVGDTELKILQSPKLMSPIVKQIDDRYPGSNYSQLKFNLIPRTNIVEVSYQDRNPEKVELLLDLLAKAYLVYSLEDRRTDVRQGIQFVDEQLPKLRKQVETLQNQLQKFRQQHDLINPTTQGEQLAAQLNNVLIQRQETQTQLSRSRALHNSLQKQLQLRSQEASAASALTQAPRYQALLNQLQEIQARIAVESSRYQDDSPAIQSLRAQEQNLLPLVEKERQNIIGRNLLVKTAKSQALASPNSIRQQQTEQFFDAANQIQSLEAQDKALAQAENVLRQQVRQFPAIVRQNDDLERQLRIAVDSLNQFLTKREVLRIDIAQKQVPWQLLTPPTEPKPAMVSVGRNLILGTALGLLLGIGVALLIDKFNNLLYTSEDVKDTTGLPLVGEIPVKQEAQQLPVLAAGLAGLMKLLDHNFKLGKRNQPSQQRNSAQFWESLRSLYTNIRFLSFDTPVRSLTIISAASEDGRSTIALHLAQTAAVMGQRVLLVDADLRNPKLHKMLALDNTRGLSNIIAGELDFQAAIHKISCLSMKAVDYRSFELTTNLKLPPGDVFFVLTAGQIPPNPTNLLSSQKMQNLARQFEADFDLIIYDTSPLLGLADSSLLATHTDASILVVGLGKTNRTALEKALDGLKISGTPVLGVVANGVTNYTSA
jgi:uncharacterized protein involved in exopolysaccharide biosynthesis/Mrp family chromosome partitioning ATPase